ncbi:MAG: DUF4394 domain-containing protein [Deltaproteobacteria bacterium]|nr:DUF4394 domain-containing protein [Deltaproteobacteria bacterium]
MVGMFASLRTGAMVLLSSVLASGMLVHWPTSATAEMLVGATETNRLVLFSSDRPRRVKTIRLSGLGPNERILGLDVRPASGQLYALGSTNQIYTINLDQRRVTPVGDPFSPALRGDFFGFDFNPQADRIRITSDANQNLRIHPDTGIVVGDDTDLAYATNDSGERFDPGAVGAAYSNNDNNQATSTTLYDIDASRDVLVVQSPPNDGVLTTVGPLGVGTPASLVVGFDISGVGGVAYAVLNSANSDRSRLFTIDLRTGAATFISDIGGPELLTSFATLGF